MNHLNRILVLAAAILVFTGLSSPAYAALVQYTYTGNPFESVSISSGNFPPPDPEPSFSHVSIEFTVDDSLVPKNATFEAHSDPTVVNFPLTNFLSSDGYFSISSSNPRTYIQLIFDTDAEGNVNGRWSVSSEADYSDLHLDTYSIVSVFNNPPTPNSDYSSKLV